MNPDFLKSVQRCGWQVQSADESGCIARCPTPGCGVRVALKSSSSIPKRAVEGWTIEKVVDSLDTGRRFLKERREDLCLTIAEVEEIAGMATDHLAKFERENWATAGTVRSLNFETFKNLAEALGYRVVLVPGLLPPLALRIISETRHMVPGRVKRRMLAASQRKAARK